jgi:tryptophan-rich sensory protein
MELSSHMSERPASKEIIGLLSWLAVTFIAAALGALASPGAKSFYAELTRPSWAPPASWFGPVWSVLYFLMAVAAWLVWRRSLEVRTRTPLVLFLLQLAVNALWSWLFFAWRLGGLAFADVAVLMALIAATVVSFWKVQRLAAALLIPYLGWVSYAAALTWSVWQSNPTLLR